MLSLFFSVGICRILRYRSSNTSMVEQQFRPRFFPYEQVGKMRNAERGVLKFNAEVVDMVFGLMFETFWVPPYDRRRGNSLLVDFERQARRTLLLLCTTDTASASESQLRTLWVAADELVWGVERITQAGLFPSRECAEAQRLIRQIRDALSTVCGSEIAQSLPPIAE